MFRYRAPVETGPKDRENLLRRATRHHETANHQGRVIGLRIFDAREPWGMVDPLQPTGRAQCVLDAAGLGA